METTSLQADAETFFPLSCGVRNFQLMLMLSFASKMQSVPLWHSLFRWNEVRDSRRNHQRLTKDKQLWYLPFKEIAELVNLFTHLKLKKRNETSQHTARHRGCSQSMCCFFFSLLVVCWNIFFLGVGWSVVQSKKNSKSSFYFFYSISISSFVMLNIFHWVAFLFALDGNVSYVFFWC